MSRPRQAAAAAAAAAHCKGKHGERCPALVRVFLSQKRAHAGPCRPTRAPSYVTGVSARTHVQAGLCVCVYTVAINVLFMLERRVLLPITTTALKVRLSYWRIFASVCVNTH